MSPTSSHKRNTADGISSLSTSMKRRRRSREAPSGGKRRDMEESVSHKYEECCQLPATLQQVLEDETTHISRSISKLPLEYDCEPRFKPGRSVHVLPATVTVGKMLQHFRNKQQSLVFASDERLDNVYQFCTQLLELFNEVLVSDLLHPEEMPQYQTLFPSIDNDMDGEFKRPSDVYGCEYLLRLLVKLPTFLHKEDFENGKVHASLLADLIVLLQKNRQACFKPSYRQPIYQELQAWEKVLADEDPMYPKRSKISPSSQQSCTYSVPMILSPARNTRARTAESPSVRSMET